MARPKTHRAPKGQGSVSKRERIINGKVYTSWIARISIRDEMTNKRKYITFSAKTQQEALAKLREAQQNIINGTYATPSKLTVAEWLDIYFSEYTLNIKPSTANVYNYTKEKYIKPQLGNIRLQALTPAHVQKYINNLSKSNLSPKSVKNCAGLLHCALQKAVQLNYISSNPAHGCVLPKVTHKPITALSAEEMKLFLNGIQGNRFESIYKLFLFSGMRESECLGLHWENIDFENSCITVNHQLYYDRVSKTYSDAPTKTCNVRTIPLPDSITEMLRTVKEKQFRDRQSAGELWQNSDNYVFTDELGHFITQKTLFNSFKRTIAKIPGLPEGLNIHSLRHSFASLSLVNGCDVKTVSELLGHSNASTTLNIYAHSNDTAKRENASRIENIFKIASSE